MRMLQKFKISLSEAYTAYIDVHNVFSLKNLIKSV